MNKEIEILKEKITKANPSFSSLFIYSPQSYLLMHEKEIEQRNLETLKDIRDGLLYLRRLFTEPMEVFKEFLTNNQDLFLLGAMVLCAYGMLSAIWGNDKGKKWVGVSIALYSIIKILVVVL